MIWGILLAAGLGRRIGTPKALLTLSGETFHQRAVGAFRDAGLDLVTVINEGLADLLPAPAPGESRLVNPDPDQASGMFASVRMGVVEAIRLGARFAIVLPVDHPLVTGEDVRLVAAHLRSGAAIVVATHGGRRGHPIGVNGVVMDEILHDPSVTTLRDIVHRYGARVVEAPVSAGAVLGVNTKEDLDSVSKRPFR